MVRCYPNGLTIRLFEDITMLLRDAYVGWC